MGGGEGRHKEGMRRVRRKERRGRKERKGMGEKERGESGGGTW